MPQRSDNPDFVSGREFSDWMREQSDFRTRLEQRINAQHGEVVDTLHRIEDKVGETNGRVRNAEGEIQSIKSRLASIEADDEKIEQTVESIRDEGCSQYAAHVAILQNNVESWSSKKKLAAAGGFISLGALIWPAVQELAAALHALLDKLP